MDSQNLTIDTVKEEKANAIARYRRFRNLKKLLQVIEGFVAVFILSWSSTCLPSVVKHSGDFLLQLSLYVLNPHVVFLIGNVIVVALIILSRHIDLGYDSADDDFHDDVIEITNSIGETKPSATTEIAVDDSEKQIVCIENAVGRTECEAVANAIEKATKQIQKFKRTQSEKLWCDMSVKHPKELRRSETEVQRTVIDSPREMDAIEKVDSMSNEEFRLTVEAFIQKQQKFLRLQKMAEIDSL